MKTTLTYTLSSGLIATFFCSYSRLASP